MLGLTAWSCCAAEEARRWHVEQAQAADAWTQVERKEHAGDTNVWIARGMVADRRAHTLEFVVDATGLGSGAIAEFLVVGEASDKDYEAVTVSFARAADICRGLEFLGLPRGRPTSPERCQFWPQGEYVQATIRQLGRAPSEGRPLAGCLLDQRPHAMLSDRLIYAGSCWQDGICLADATSPGALISTYNEPTAVLEFPDRMPQAEVYGSLVVSTNGGFDRGALLVIALTPDMLPNGVARVAKVSLQVRRRVQADRDGVAGVECVTCSPDPAIGAATNDFQGALERLAALAKAGRDPFVTVSLDDALTVGTARDLARVLAMVEGVAGLRVDSPPAGQLYFKAFLPDERWRARAERPSQPWELHASRNPQGAWNCTLVQILESWSREGQLAPDLQATPFSLGRQEDLPGKIRELIEAQIAGIRQKRAAAGRATSADDLHALATLKRINTIFVFAPPDAPLGAFLPALRLVHDTLPQVHVFVE